MRLGDTIGAGWPAEVEARNREVLRLCQRVAESAVGKRHDLVEVDVWRDLVSLFDRVEVRVRVGDREVRGGSNLPPTGDAEWASALFDVVASVACRLYLPVFRIGRDARRLTR